MKAPTLFVDPDLKFVFLNRILFALDNPERWDCDIMPRQNKYVIFGQDTCQKKEALVYLLKKHNVVYECTTLEEDSFTNTPVTYEKSTRIVVIENGRYLPTQEHEIADDSFIYIVLNNLPPNHRNNNKMFWKDTFDYRLSYATPDAATAKEMFMSQIKSFNSDNINIDNDGFETLANAAKFCTFRDIQLFCRKLFYDTTYNPDLEINIDVLKQRYLFIDGHSGNFLLEKETRDKETKRSIQVEYAPEDMPSYNNKRLKLDQ